ncbi:uncharacterized protein LOC125064929 isoform X1 [Vanessa atalanta]|uniref:uncharacterized protein LOC125064929 isoform X1 n=1 Tax=Vanessa atalanta TaxID=42275 RepID=UPI001FCD938B|nr:uncharacterized protein LOC125064929 isoform X1 [Vanessa atalanta]
MVIQKTSTNIDANKNIAVDNTASGTWNFQAPTKIINIRTNTAATMQAKQPITRQIAISTLAAMHRRFSLPGPVQPHSRPIAEFRASANKSLDMLRQTIQSAVTREIDQVIKKYLEKFFVPAVNNIRLNLGDESVSEDQVRAVCRAMLDATRLLYSTPSRTTQPGYETTDDNADNKLTKQTLQNPQSKRKDTDIDIDFIRAKKIKQEEIIDGASSPLPSPAIRDPEKWNPARLTQDTLFIMGSHAHKVLGLGNSRGRLYTRHAGLLRYPADSVDKEWIANHNLVNAVGGKTYIMVLEDIEELARSDAYKHSSLPLLGELTGFKVPPFMLRKIKGYVLRRSLSGDLNADSPQPSTSVVQEEKFKIDDIKLEVHDDFDSANFNASQYMTNSDNSRAFAEVPMMKEDTDFADIKVEDIDDIKVDGIKMEDLDEMKVDGIKVEDLDVNDIKVENIDDINVDAIKVEDIKLETDDAFDLCKQADDEQSNLVDGLLEADIEFLSRNLGNIESDADARKTIEKLTGANPDTITLVGDEFDLGTTLNTHNFTGNQSTKCITVASTTSGMIHSVPVAHIAPPRITGSTVHYYTSSGVQPSGQRTIHHLPQATVTIQSIPGSNSHMIRGIPINAKSGTISTVVSQGTGSTIIGFGTRTSNATIIGTPQYVNVSSKSFPTGNILHNAIVSKNIINRNVGAASPGVSFNVTTVRPSHTTTPKSTVVTATSADYDNISTTKDMIDNACNSSLMLKKVLTLGSAAASKSFMMHNTQKVLSTGFANGVTPPPNVTIVSSGTSGGMLNNPNIGGSSMGISSNGNLSATHATLSALLASNAENVKGKNN